MFHVKHKLLRPTFGVSREVFCLSVPDVSRHIYAHCEVCQAAQPAWVP
jgi:hypothetical protein